MNEFQLSEYEKTRKEFANDVKTFAYSCTGRAMHVIACAYRDYYEKDDDVKWRALARERLTHWERMENEKNDILTPIVVRQIRNAYDFVGTIQADIVKGWAQRVPMVEGDG